ncbi:hypothetical protein SOVF_120890 [Spinacia oleracea]|nr:hypothetical protein SOVF_120890 [Spinacia oleracea]
MVMVHLRCFHNNRYLVRESETSHWINADANEVEEDTSRWSCTLFAVENLTPGDPNLPLWTTTRLRFRHVQSGAFLYGYLHQGSGTSRIRRLGIYVQGESGASSNPTLWIRMTDWELLTILPEVVAFKGSNGRYLATVRRQNIPNWDQNTHHLQFSSNDIGDEAVRFELDSNNFRHDGLIRIRSLLRDFRPTHGFWRSNGQNREIVVSTSLTGTDFRGVKVDDADMAFDGGLCYSRRFPNNVLHLGTETTITREAIVRVEEPVLSRQVYNVNYRLEDARIYDQTPIVLASFPVTNNSQTELVRTIGFNYEDKTETTWNAFLSFHLGVRIRIRAGKPLIFGASIQINATFDAEYEWGETKTETITLTDSATIRVPPMSSVVARLVATRGRCDIPFSYTVRDVLTTGQTRIYQVDGGVFNGVNNYNIDLTVDPA